MVKAAQSNRAVWMIQFTSLKAWRVARVDATGEPLLIVETFDHGELAIMLPAQAAVEMGTALEQAGEQARRPANVKPN